MEAKGSTFLKVTGILMIVFGVITLIVSIIAIPGVGEQQKGLLENIQQPYFA